MTRAQQVEAALELISPRQDRRDHCRGNVEYMLDDMARLSGINARLKSVGAKAGTRAWNAHHKALGRLLVTHDELVATGWPGMIERAAIVRAIAATTPEQLRYRRRVQEACAYTDRPGLRAAGIEQTRAVELAHDLLSQWWGGDKLITTTRTGTWARLSAILYGDPDADLFRYLRAFSNTPGAKKSQQVS